MSVQASGVLDRVNTLIDSKEALTALTVALVTAVGTGVWALLKRRRRIEWRILYDEPINQGDPDGDQHNLWEIEFGGERVDKGSFVVLEVRNAGSDNITGADFDPPPDEDYAFCFEFGGRRVRNFKVRDIPRRSHNDDYRGRIQRFARAVDPSHPGRLALPRISFNRRSAFKLMVLVSGHRTDDTAAVSTSGSLTGGDIDQVETASHLARNLTVAATVLALAGGVVGGVWLANRALRPAATPCASGKLELEGSSAFAPIATEAAASYMQTCHDATVDVVANGSQAGVADVASSGSLARIAMSDGAATTAASGSLTPRPVGVIVFAVVANKSLAAGGSDPFAAGMSVHDLAAVFDGEPTADGNHYIAVGRKDQSSGTRSAFDALIGGPETALGADAPTCGSTASAQPPTPASKAPTSPAPTSPAAEAKACVAENTMALLTYINDTPGAIGYAEADALPYFQNVGVVPVQDNVTRLPVTPSRENALNGSYKFVATEYLYPAEPVIGLTDAFITYLTGETTAARLRGHEFIACPDLAGSQIAGDCAVRGT